MLAMAARASSSNRPASSRCAQIQAISPLFWSSSPYRPFRISTLPSAAASSIATNVGVPKIASNGR